MRNYRNKRDSGFGGFRFGIFFFFCIFGATCDSLGNKKRSTKLALLAVDAVVVVVVELGFNCVTTLSTYYYLFYFIFFYLICFFFVGFFCCFSICFALGGEAAGAMC